MVSSRKRLFGSVQGCLLPAAAALAIVPALRPGQADLAKGGDGLWVQGGSLWEWPPSPNPSLRRLTPWVKAASLQTSASESRLMALLLPHPALPLLSEARSKQPYSWAPDKAGTGSLAHTAPGKALMDPLVPFLILNTCFEAEYFVRHFSHL